MPKSSDPKSIRHRLLCWYDVEHRNLPWRAEPDIRPEPYHVWLSEIMLQQTTVATVVPYFGEFVTRWPDVCTLAAAPLDDVLHAWQGLGYYARARNLHKCAARVANELGGAFPDTEAALLAMPGVGVYTAAAIAAIAFERPVVPVDGNVERVTARLYGVRQQLKQSKKRIARLAQGLAADYRPGDFAQAMMDLGATVCRSKAPACGDCPLVDDCMAANTGRPEEYPGKATKPMRPTRCGVAFWAVRPDGAVLLRRRPTRGLLGGMMEVPSTEWRENKWSLIEAAAAAPVDADWQPLAGVVKHTFTHFHLEITVLWGRVTKSSNEDGVWSPPAQFFEHALPTVMKKVAAHAETHW